MTGTGSPNTRVLVGATARRVRRKLDKLGFRVHRFYQNTRRLSRFNDEEAWEADGVTFDGRGAVTLFSWDTLTTLARAKTIEVLPETGALGSTRWEVWGGE